METFELRDGELIRLDIPTDARMAVHRQWAMIALLSDWSRDNTTYTAGSVLVADYEQLVAGTAELRVVFRPGGDDFFAGGAFSGESMFYLRANASKLAFLYLIEHLQKRGLDWIDIQMLTPHLEAMGAREIDRSEFLQKLALTQKRKLTLFGH